MPFLAVCPECHYSQVCVLPANTFPRVKCGRCRGVYDPVGTDDTEVIPELAGATLVRLVQERRAARAQSRAAQGRRRRRTRRRGPPAVGAAPLSAEAIAAAILSEPVPGPAGPPRGPDPVTPETQSAPVAATGPRPNRPPRPRRAPPAGTSAIPLAAGSFFLAGVTLVAAGNEATGFLARPLAVASLLLGLWGVWAAVRGQARARYAVLVTGLAAAVAAVAFGVPGRIGLGAPEAPAWAEADVQVVPFPQFAADPAVWAAEWVDACKAALQQGPVRVAVLDVRVGGLGPNLVVRLRLSRTPGLDRPGESADWDPAQSAALWDAAGARYDQVSVVVRPPAGSAAARGHKADPGEASDDGTVVALEFPRPPRPGPLRLELPASAWGGRGQFRFTIPAGAVNW